MIHERLRPWSKDHTSADVELMQLHQIRTRRQTRIRVLIPIPPNPFRILDETISRPCRYAVRQIRIKAHCRTAVTQHISNIQLTIPLHAFIHAGFEIIDSETGEILDDDGRVIVCGLVGLIGDVAFLCEGGAEQ